VQSALFLRKKGKRLAMHVFTPCRVTIYGILVFWLASKKPTVPTCMEISLVILLLEIFHRFVGNFQQ
jgi:hypothetical protein